MYYRGIAGVLLLMLLVFTLLPTGIIASALPSPYNNMIKELGIRIPELKSTPSITLSLSDIDLNVGYVLDYSVVSLRLKPSDWINTFINSPGLPDLPVLIRVVKVDGYVPKELVKVGVVVKDFYIMKVKEPIVPTPQPLVYMPVGRQDIMYSPNTSIYLSDKFFPGRLVSLDVWHGLRGKTLIIVRFYPVNYNPKEDTLLVIKDADIMLAYPKPLKEKVINNSVLILTSKALVNTTNQLIKLYKNLGYNVTVATVEEINSTYKPAEPPKYPGYANPFRIDPIYLRLKESYDFNLSLKIISFLRANEGRYSHIFIIGDARTVPPSYYYQYPIYTGLDPYNSWIPTDFFYASPDYDLAPNFYIGRVPFSDPSLIKRYIEKEIGWYNSSVSRSYNLALSGGYPFLTPVMFGESAISTFTYRNSTSHFNVTVMTRTLGNYNNLTVKEIFEGKKHVVWYFALSHGSGDALGDILLVGKQGEFPKYKFEILMTARDLLHLKQSFDIPIISSVACMNGAWDEVLVRPTYFMPPSFGEAVLLSPAGGIAYIGSARIAWELTGPSGLYEVINGTLLAQYYGASLLHEEILRAYNNLGVQGTTLGEVYEDGITNYLVKALGLYGKSVDSAIVLSEAFKAELLGDPALKLPKLPATRPVEAYISKVRPLNFTLLFNLTKFRNMVIPWSSGEIPIYKSKSYFTLCTRGINGSYHYKLIRIFKYFSTLSGYTTIDKGALNITPTGTILVESISREASGLLLVEFYKQGWGMTKFVLGSFNIELRPPKQVAGGLINITAYGLDLFGIRYIDLAVVGRIVARNIPVSPIGEINWTTTLPYLAPGRYTVTLYPQMYIIIASSSSSSYQYISGALPEELIRLFSSTITVYKEGSIDFVIGSPSISEPGRITISIETLYEGKLIPSLLNISVNDPSGRNINYNLSGADGSYVLKFEAETLGTYIIKISARGDSELLDVRGTAFVPITVLYNVYNGTGYLSALLGYTEKNVENVLSNIKIIKDNVFIVKTELGDLIGKINIINGTLLEIKTSLGTVLLNISDIITGIKKLNETTVLIKTRIGDLEGKIISVNNNVMRVSTSLGELAINVNNLKASTQEMNTTLSSAISRNYNEISTTKSYALLASIIALLALLTAATAVVLIRRR